MQEKHEFSFLQGKTEYEYPYTKVVL